MNARRFDAPEGAAAARPIGSEPIAGDATDPAAPVPTAAAATEATAAASAERTADAATEPVNVLIVGVGGQGVILVSKVLAWLAQSHGFEVKQSEVHGMAKRGGSVFSHVRFGPRVWSPTIPRGEADLLVALEWAEGMRWLPYLKPDTGVFVCDTKRIVPPFACLNRRPGAPLRYARETPQQVREHVAEAYAIDATEFAEALGNERTANVVLLGALSVTLDFPVAQWERSLAEFVPQKTIPVNIEAFRRGREWIEHARSERVPRETVPEPGHTSARAVPAAADAPYEVRLEITPHWCKSCDICVKLCPERCLRLNDERVVELTDPAQCTGCRLCEWLCPDFAIRVHLDQVPGTQDERATLPAAASASEGGPLVAAASVSEGAGPLVGAATAGAGGEGPAGTGARR